MSAYAEWSRWNVSLRVGRCASVDQSTEFVSRHLDLWAYHPDAQSWRPYSKTRDEKSSALGEPERSRLEL
jgi:hypothetical protein